MALPTRQTRPAPAPGRAAAPPPNAWLMLAVLLLGQFMCIVDVLVTNVAMPSIAASLRASGASLQLVVGGYTIAYAMLLITGARLGDRYGRRRAYLAGVLVFTAASLACALAPDSPALIGFRLVQGAGAAVLVPQVFSIIQLNFAGPARARALSAYTAVLSAGAVAGLVLGGVVVSANLFGTGWRPVFAINVPLGIVLAVLVPRLVPADQPGPAGPGPAGPGPAGPGKLDLAGLATAASAVLLIVLPLVLGPETGWPAWCSASLAAGAGLAACFVLLERRVAARGGHPLLNLAVLRARALPSGLVTLALTQIGYGGLLFAFTLHLQAGLGQSALRAGLSYVPFAAVFGLAGYNWRRLPAAARQVLVPAGLAVTVAAYLGLATALHEGSHGGTGVLTWAGLAAVGLGLGLSVSPLLTQSLTHVPPARAADASGLLTTTVQLGQLLGVAAVGSVYLSRAGAIHAGAVHAGAVHAGAVHAGPGRAGAAQAGYAARAAASAAAMSGTACWLAALSVAGLLAAVVMVRAARGRRPRPGSRSSA
jgi:MFS family permease